MFQYYMKYTLALFISFFSCILYAQSIAMSEIPTMSQLPVNAIHRLFQDSEGYMWYGTVNGLCRDDGYRVQVFRSDIYQPALLANNLVECIAEDKEGKIWFGTDNGVYILNKTDYHIQALSDTRLKNKQILTINVTRDGAIWVGIYGFLLKYHSDGTPIKAYPILNGQQQSSVSGFCENRQGTIIVTYSNGLIHQLNPKNDSFQPFPAGMKRNNPTEIIQDREHDYYWLATWGDGIVRFDPTASPDSMYTYQSLPITSMGQEDGVILYLVQDDKHGYLWATTSRDLTAFSTDKDMKLQQISLTHLMPSSNRMLNEVIKDRSGNLWVSAFDQPSFILHFMQDIPRNYPLPAIRKQTGYSPAIMAMSDASNDMMWISQERTGIMLYNLNTNELISYTDCPATKTLPLHSSREMAASRAADGAWITPLNSQQAYCLTQRKMQMQLVSKVDLSDIATTGSYIRKLLEDTKGRLWIGTSVGLYQYNPKHQKRTILCDTIGQVTAMAETSNGELWVCTNDKGLYKVQSDNSLLHYPSRQSFSSIAITTDGMLWMGTEEGGVCAFNPRDSKWQDYTAACGMNGDQVNQIAADAFNHLWIDTNQKLIEFNPRNGSFRTYLATDGSMPLWRLLPTTICKGLNGNIYFGGIPGICSVTPSNRLESEARPVRTFITHIKVLDRSIAFGLPTSPNAIKSIDLPPDTRNLEINFSSLNHRYASKIRYAYRLKGVDTDWIYTPGGHNTAFYNYLSKGHYVFEIKSTDENGLWSHEVTTLHIYRLPAFYETWWATLLYLLLAIGTLIWCTYLYKKRIERKNKELYADSEELIKMQHYLTGRQAVEVQISDIEFAQLDEVLLHKVMKAIENNLSEPDFDVSTLAEQVNMSRSTLTRKLKVITGRTPLEYIRQVKMQHAKRLLEDKNKTIAEVAMMLGYFNRKYFTSCFKEEFGVTPSEYQKNVD